MAGTTRKVQPRLGLVRGPWRAPKARKSLSPALSTWVLEGSGGLVA